MLKYRYTSPSSSSSIVSQRPSSVIASIEKLFVLRRFDEALFLTYSALLDLSKDISHDARNKGKAKYHAEDIAQELMLMDHRCASCDDCPCIAMLSLLVQILYEMGRARDAIPCVSNFYGDILKTPYDVLFLCVNLLINALEDFLSAKNILMLVLEENQLEDEQREELMELLVFHVLIPLSEADEAVAFLQFDRSLPQWKKEGWINHIKATIQITKDSKEVQKEGAILVPTAKHTIDKQTLNHFVSSLLSRTRNLANYLLLMLRKNYQSQIGLFAISSAFILACFYLFYSWKTTLMESVSYNNIKKLQKQGQKGRMDRTALDVSKQNKSFFFWYGKNSL